MATDKELAKISSHFRELCLNHAVVFDQKNFEYDNTIEATGVLGACVELIGASARLKALVLRNPKHGENKSEELKDILCDIHNYANIAFLMLIDSNWSGK